MHTIDGRTRVCGLMGDPVEHTLSPLIHNTLARDLGHNFVYVPLQVERGQVEEAVRGAWALHLQGMNVTVPHKSAVIPWLKEMDELAEKIGAVNTLVPCRDGYKGYNTDMTGIKRAMESEGIRLCGETVILLGAGGAARAVAFLCAFSGAERVYLLNRTLERAQETASEVNRAFGRDCIMPLPLSGYEKIPDGKYLAVQGTSVGLHPHTEETVIADDAFYEKIHTGYDLIYKPYDTKFMRLVRAHGGRACNGMKMLVYQAIHAYELWNGVEIETAEAEKIIRILKEEMGING